MLLLLLWLLLLLLLGTVWKSAPTPVAYVPTHALQRAPRYRILLLHVYRGQLMRRVLLDCRVGCVLFSSTSDHHVCLLAQKAGLIASTHLAVVLSLVVILSEMALNFRRFVDWVGFRPAHICHIKCIIAWLTIIQVKTWTWLHLLGVASWFAQATAIAFSVDSDLILRWLMNLYQVVAFDWTTNPSSELGSHALTWLMMAAHYLLGVLLRRLLEQGDKGTSFARLLLGVPGPSTALLLRIISFRLLLTDTTLIQRVLNKWAQGLQRLMPNFGSLNLLVLTTGTSQWRLLPLRVPRDKVLNLLLLLTTCETIN